MNIDISISGRWGNECLQTSWSLNMQWMMPKPEEKRITVKVLVHVFSPKTRSVKAVPDLWQHGGLKCRHGVF